MTALWYIIRRSAVNGLKELLRKPGKLILYALALAGIVGVAVLSIFTRQAAGGQAPMFWLTGVVFLYVTLFIAIAVVKGVSNGDVIFEMCDVNLLFVSPVNPDRILLYGILRLTKVSFLAGFFILFQTNSLANFGIGFGGVLLIFLCVSISTVVLSMVSLLIYSATNGNAKRKLLAKCAACALFLPLIGRMLFAAAGADGLLAGMEAAIRSPFLSLVPVAGWTAAGVTALLTGALTEGLLYMGANLLLCAALVAYILLANLDYYEDTLVATETAFERKRTVAEGNINVAPDSAKKFSVAKTGVSGRGASALFGKHMRESFRQNRFGFLTLPSALIIAGGILMTVLARDLLVPLMILVWSQIMLIGTGRGMRETYSHYIYMVPESSFAKIVWSNMEVMVKTLLESALIFGVSGAIIGANAFVIAGCVVAYTLYSFLLLGVNYLSMRIVDVNLGIGLMIVIYYVFVVLAMLPGVIPAVMLGEAVGGDAGIAAGLAVLSVWELLAGCCLIALSKGVLHRCDMPAVKPKG